MRRDGRRDIRGGYKSEVERPRRITTLRSLKQTGSFGTYPPTLECSGRKSVAARLFKPHFSREVGLTIPQFLRNARMERAAELLRTGRYNVTDGDREVGYSSLSHFSQLFCETIGCCPVLYPAAKHIRLSIVRPQMNSAAISARENNARFSFTDCDYLAAGDRALPSWQRNRIIGALLSPLVFWFKSSAPALVPRFGSVPRLTEWLPQIFLSRHAYP